MAKRPARSYLVQLLVDSRGPMYLGEVLGVRSGVRKIENACVFMFVGAKRIAAEYGTCDSPAGAQVVNFDGTAL